MSRKIKILVALSAFIIPTISYGSIGTFLYKSAEKGGYQSCATPLKEVAHFLDGISSGSRAEIRTSAMDHKDDGFRAVIVMKGNNKGYSTVSHIFAIPVGENKCTVSYNFVTYLPSNQCKDLELNLQNKFGSAHVENNGDGGRFWVLHHEGQIYVFNDIPDGGCYFDKTGGSLFLSTGVVP